MSSSQHSSIPKKLLPFLALVWSAIFLLGVIGHLEMKNPVGDSIFKTLQLFHLHYHPAPGAEASHHQAVSWFLEVARFGGALWGLALLPLLVVFLFEERCHRWWVSIRWRNHYVVCGRSSRSLALVRDLRRQKKKVVLVGHCSDTKQALPAGVLSLVGDPGDPALLAIAGVHRAAYLVALHEDDRENVETLVAAGLACAPRSRTRSPLNAFAHIADQRLEASLRRIDESSTGIAGVKVRLHFFNFYELMARLLSRQFPVPPALTDSRPQLEHIVVVGFAAFGQSVVAKIIRMSQQLYQVPDGQWQVAKPRITVVDPCADPLLAEFKWRHPGIHNYCDLDTCSIATTDIRFLEMPFLKGNAPNSRTTMIFCPETESNTMREISLIGEIASEPSCPVDRIYLRIARPERLGPVLEALQREDRKPRVVCFAPDREVFTSDVLLNQRLDVLAKAIHEEWLTVEEKDRRSNNLPPAAGKSWDQLEPNDRESNREAADHLWAKLRVLGYELQDVPQAHRPIL